MRLHCFFTVNKSVNAARSSLNGVCRRKFHGKAINFVKRLFTKVTWSAFVVWCSRGVVVRYNRVELKVPGSSPTKYLVFFPSFFLFFAFFVLLFPIKMRLNNCDLIECNKQKETYRVSRENIVYRIWNIWINNVNFYHFLQFTVGKPELITIWSFSKQRMAFPRFFL